MLQNVTYSPCKIRPFILKKGIRLKNQISSIYTVVTNSFDKRQPSCFGRTGRTLKTFKIGEKVVKFFRKALLNI